MEGFFKYANTFNNKNVKLVAFNLKVGPRHGGINYKTIDGAIETTIKQWPKMLCLMKKWFLPINYRQIL